MFEEQQEEDKQSSKRGTIVLITIVLVLLIVGGIVYADSKGMFSSSPSTAAKAPVPVANADPVKDLRILSTKMDKDITGTTAVWLVDVKNASPTLTYSHIMYETTYGAADNSLLGQNKGEIPSLTLGPGEEQSAQFKDAAYPSGTAWFRVKITGATATQ